MTYQFKTEPFGHQREYFELTKDLPAFCFFWEQGCGKTKPIIDTGAYLYEKGEIDAIFVVAPNGVHRNWLTDELPTHMPDRVVHVGYFLDSHKVGLKRSEPELERLLRFEGLVVLTVSYDGLCTDKVKKYVSNFLRKRRVLYVVDESQYAKTPSAYRTRAAQGAAKLAPYKRVLSGTPVAKGPFDVYSQVKIVDDQFWKRKGIEDFGGFKTVFGVFEKKPFGPLERVPAHERTPENPQEMRRKMVDMVVGYRNLDKLQEWLKEIGHRLTKEDAGLKLPPKVYSKRWLELSKQQRKLYNEIKDQYFAELEGGALVEAPLAITRLLRFQQIVCGYVGDIDGNMHKIDGPNPRLEAMEDIRDQTTTQGIVWARFTADIDQLMDVLPGAVRYDGSVSDDGRAKAKAAFQAGDAQWFIGNPAAGATGLTLVQAKKVVYYSNSFRFVDRLQSEDRAHRIGQTETVNYIDLVASHTVDEHIVKTLRSNLDVASQITGDALKEWI